MEEKAARAYDLAALKYWGSSTHINFPVSKFGSTFGTCYCGRFQLLVFDSVGLFWQLEDYTTQIEEMKNMNRQEYVAHLRRQTYDLSYKCVSCAC